MNEVLLTEPEERPAAEADDELSIRWIAAPAAGAGVRRSRITAGTLFGMLEGEPRLAGPGMSKCHAEIVLTGKLLSIFDRSSSYGTWVDGCEVERGPDHKGQVRAATGRPIGPGQVVRMGEWVGIVEPRKAPDYVFLDLFPKVVGLQGKGGWWGGPGMGNFVEKAQRSARGKKHVLLMGETGTGKEGMALALHAWSGRPSERFHAVNSATLQPGMAAAELFGHVQNAFNGAIKNPGLFLAANGGTLFLDEISKMPEAVRSMLYLVLEKPEVRAVGAHTPQSVDVMVIAAVEAAGPNAKKSDDELRGSLAKRFPTHIVLPPLRERREDIIPLFEMFVRRELSENLPMPSLNAKLVELLLLYNWPENVRELNLVASHMASSREQTAIWWPSMVPKHTLEAFNQQIIASQAAAVSVVPAGAGSPRSSVPRAKCDITREELQRALDATKGNISQATRRLGTSDDTVNRFLKLNLDLREEARRLREKHRT